jgi:hypothetical protein
VHLARAELANANIFVGELVMEYSKVLSGSSAALARSAVLVSSPAPTALIHVGLDLFTLESEHKSTANFGLFLWVIPDAHEIVVLRLNCRWSMNVCANGCHIGLQENESVTPLSTAMITL